MKMFLRLLVIVFCGSLVSSCFDPPEYPNTPEISFKSVNFVKGGINSEGNPISDTVILILNFKDGDGNIGIASDELQPPFNDRWYFTKERLSRDNTLYDDCTSYDSKCWFLNPTKTEFDKYVDYDDFRKTPDLSVAGSTLFYDSAKKPSPDYRSFKKSYNCTNWEVVYYDHDNNASTDNVPLDTLFFKLNPHYNNIFVKFEIKNDNPADPGNPFDRQFDETQFFTYPLCGIRPFDGRVPVLFDATTKDTPLEGTIRYAIPSVSFQTIFGSQTLRLRVYIEDRTLNKSNEVVTNEFNVNIAN